MEYIYEHPDEDDKFPEYTEMWETDDVGGPLDKMRFTHPGVLETYRDMPLDFEKGAGIYVFYDAYITKNGGGTNFLRDYYIMYTGHHGTSKLRQKAETAYAEDDWPTLSKIVNYNFNPFANKGAGCYRMSYNRGKGMQEILGDIHKGRGIYRYMYASKDEVRCYNWAYGSEDGVKIIKNVDTESFVTFSDNGKTLDKYLIPDFDYSDYLDQEIDSEDDASSLNSV